MTVTLFVKRVSEGINKNKILREDHPGLSESKDKWPYYRRHTEKRHTEEEKAMRRWKQRLPPMQPQAEEHLPAAAGGWKTQGRTVP